MAGTKNDKGAIIPLLGMVTLAWVLEVGDALVPGNSMDKLLGIFPRTVSGLIGVFTSPFAHGGFLHLISNTIPWLILGVFVSFGEKKRFVETTVWLIVLSGLGTWLIGRPSVHVGASGLVYGYMGYVMGRGWYLRRPLWVITALLALMLFGGMVYGVVPTRSAVSWEGHLAGLIGGFFLARSRRDERRLSQ